MFFIQKNKQKGLTLIELLAVIAIIAILFVLLIPQISSAIDKSRKTGTLTDFRSFEVAARSMFMENPDKFKDSNLFNNYLDTDLKFIRGYSNKANAYGEKYEFYPTSNNMIEIKTSNGKNKDIGMLIFNNNGEIKTHTFGLNLENEMSKKSFEGMNYIVIDNAITITDYNGDSADIIIPSQINGIKVSAIASHAFSKLDIRGLNKGKTLKSVVVEEGIEFIGDSAFRMNEIETVVIPKTVKRLEYGTFANNKIHTLSLPNELEYIGMEAFNHNKLKSVILPSNLTSIEKWAFNANQLTSLSLPTKLEYIGVQAFNVNSLTDVVIPSSVKTIDQGAFLSNPMKSHKILGNTSFAADSFPQKSVPSP